MTNSDVVLISIDCWREDSLDRMDNFSQIAQAEGMMSSTAVCQSSATYGATAAFLASQYPPQAYVDSGGVKPGVESLATVLSEHDYATGAFIGSNPYAGLWGEHFDYVWNDGLTDAPTDTTRVGKSLKAFSHRLNLHYLKYLLLRQKASAPRVAGLAEEWYTTRDRPRFLWVHLNDLHEPYLPGLRHGLDIGLLEVYRALVEHERAKEDLPPDTLAVHRELYRRCVDILDNRLGQIFEFLDDDATIVVMADHGQEFQHGVHMHARPYDEVVKVPLFVKWTLGTELKFPEGPTRQIDIPPTLLDGLDISPPDGWEGVPVDESGGRTAYSMTHVEYLDTIFTSIRTDRYKLIKKFETGTHAPAGTELYDLHSDPDETNNVYSHDDDAAELEADLTSFLTRKDIGFDNTGPMGPDAGSPIVQSRLKELGYLE